MKRLFAGLLCLCLLLAAAGCTPTTETVESPGFSRSWVASEPAVSHEVGGLAVDDGWGSIVSNDAVAGSLCSLELDLKATVYTLVVRALTQTVSATDNTPVDALEASTRSSVSFFRRLLLRSSTLIYSSTRSLAMGSFFSRST